MRKATSILVLVLMFFANASFAHGRCGGGGCSSHESSCCKKEMKMCKKEMKRSCCSRYHEASSCGYCQHKDHDCMRDCHPDPCPNHHCGGCYVNNERNGMVEFNRCDHSCDGCHPQDM